MHCFEYILPHVFLLVRKMAKNSGDKTYANCISFPFKQFFYVFDVL